MNRRRRQLASPLVRGHHARQISDLQDPHSYLHKEQAYRGFRIPKPTAVNKYAQRLDHFNFDQEDLRFDQRYLVYDGYVKNGQVEEIYFYSGNEGPIDMFYYNTGLIFEIAKERNGIVIFAEHRYYGKSIPFGDDAFKSGNHKFLSMDQALMDYVELISALKEDFNNPDAKVITFGGSYGGMLSFGARALYPHIFDGAIAASAPIFQFVGLTKPNVFNHIVTLDYQKAGCSDAISESFTRLQKLSTSAKGRAKIANAMNLCSVPQDNSSVVNSLFGLMENAFVDMSMLDYPTVTSFLVPDLPRWPVNVTCARINAVLGHFKPADATDELLLQAVATGLNVYYNSEGNKKCLKTTLPDKPSGNMLGWDVQTCSEMVMPIGSIGGKNDMFFYAPWNWEQYIISCQDQFGLRPKLHYFQRMYVGNRQISSRSNIFFSQGLLDPWHGGGVLTQYTDELPYYMIQNGAHHLDLRPSNHRDPEDVRACRLQEKTQIIKWLTEK